MESTICSECGTPFVPIRTNHIFCSTRCANAVRVRRFRQKQCAANEGVIRSDVQAALADGNKKLARIDREHRSKTRRQHRRFTQRLDAQRVAAERTYEQLSMVARGLAIENMGLKSLLLETKEEQARISVEIQRLQKTHRADREELMFLGTRILFAIQETGYSPDIRTVELFQRHGEPSRPLDD